MSLMNRIFGGEEVINHTIDTVSRVVDDAFYTAEEQAENKAEAKKEGQRFLLTWLEATSPSRLARRVLAFAFTGVFLFMLVASTLLSIVAVWFGEVTPAAELVTATHLTTAAQLTASAEIIDTKLLILENPITWIMGFYFAPQLLEQAGKGMSSLFGRR